MPIGLPTAPVAPVAPITPPAQPDATTATTGAAESFAATLSRGLDNVQQLQNTADGLAVQAATGDLQDVHDYTLAATKAQLATELTVAIRNKAVESFSEIMRMPV
jgi:flagellar hook-basal body complex protein FliE